jgi:hypothetical protein
MIGFISKLVNDWYRKRKIERAVDKMFDAAERQFSFSEEQVKKINEDFDAKIRENLFKMECMTEEQREQYKAENAKSWERFDANSFEKNLIKLKTEKLDKSANDK